MTTISARQESPEILEYRAKSIGWKMSRCPDWCSQKHLTDAIWFERNSFHQSDTVTVHLPAVPDTDVTLDSYETDIEVYIDAAGPAMKKKWGPSISISNPGNTCCEDQTVLDADQAEELAHVLLDMARKLRDGGTTAPWTE